jgi:serine/threonine-protein kinase HipA
MNQLSISILKTLLENKDDYVTRSELEIKIQRVSKRAILNELKKLSIQKRIFISGRSSSTAYKISSEYYELFEHTLYIYQNQILIGYLGFDYENYFFAYDTKYLLNIKHNVKFQMPFSFETFIQNSCFVDFEEFIAEGDDRKILIEKAKNATEFFLLEYTDYSLNDMIFSKEKLSFDAELKNENYLTNKEKILGKNKFPNILKYDININDSVLFPSNYLDNDEKIKEIRTMSLSGYQHKLQIVIENNTLRVPKNEEDVNYFVKPYHPLKADEKSDYYFPHIAINEHLHLTFAKNELDFDVPLSGIFKRDEDKEYHYFIKYFDRFKAFKFQRKEFSTYMGLNSETKYKTSSEKLFDIASKVLIRESDRLRMLEYYFYSFVIRHEDMHTKNISTIYDNDKVFIAPLYDIATTGFYVGIKNLESHLPINAIA